jgi:hypothetical protein
LYKIGYEDETNEYDSDTFDLLWLFNAAFVGQCILYCLFVGFRNHPTK